MRLNREILPYYKLKSPDSFGFWIFLVLINRGQAFTQKSIDCSALQDPEPIEKRGVNHSKK